MNRHYCIDKTGTLNVNKYANHAVERAANHRGSPSLVIVIDIIEANHGLVGRLIADQQSATIVAVKHTGISGPKQQS